MRKQHVRAPIPNNQYRQCFPLSLYPQKCVVEYNLRNPFVPLVVLLLVVTVSCSSGHARRTPRAKQYVGGVKSVYLVLRRCAKIPESSLPRLPPPPRRPSRCLSPGRLLPPGPEVNRPRVELQGRSPSRNSLPCHVKPEVGGSFVEIRYTLLSL